MTELKLPKSPAQAYRDEVEGATAFRAGVALRIVWEVAKPLVAWSLVITVAMVLGIFYFFGKVLFGNIKS